MFNTEEDYNNQLQDSSGFDEDEEGEYESSGEDEVWVLHNDVGIELGGEISLEEDPIMVYVMLLLMIGVIFIMNL